MIHPHNNANANRWAHEEFQVQLNLAGHTQPMGYCDGTEEDERELRSQAEAEGVEDLRIEKKLLKTGRQIWTLGDVPTEDDPDAW